MCSWRLCIVLTECDINMKLRQQVLNKGCEDIKIDYPTKTIEISNSSHLTNCNNPSDVLMNKSAKAT